MLLLDMLTPQIRHYELRQKNSRYANFSDYLPPAMLFLIFFKKIPDMLILVIYLPPAMLFLISQKNSRYANFSAVFTPNYAIVSCVKKFRYADFSDLSTPSYAISD